MASVRIDNVSKRFGATTALSQVSLEIASGEICFLLGPSGCGKTTLLRSIAGFVQPDEGRIFLGDRDLTRVPPHLRGTALMFQSYALWPHLTVAQNIAFGLEERKTPAPEIQSRVAEMLGILHLEGCAHRRIHELSGGQQQRVALARALVIQPQCLLLDEPLSNLDTRLRVETRGEIRRLCRQFGLTAIYVSHDQKEALSIGDRVVVMEDGCLRQAGPPLQVYRQPGSRFVAEFLGETNLFPAQLTGAHGTDLTISTEAGPFQAALPSGHSPPASASLLASIRPECWCLQGTPAPVNSCPGRVIETTYLGEMARHRFALASGPQLTIYELNPRPWTDPGAPLFATVAPMDVVLIAS